MRAQGLISVVLSTAPNCFPLSPLVCHSNFLEGNVEKIVHSIGGICGVSYVWFLPKALRGTVDSPEYKRRRHHKQAAAYTSIWRKAARAVCDITHTVLPPSRTCHHLYKLSHWNRKIVLAHVFWRGWMWNIAPTAAVSSSCVKSQSLSLPFICKIRRIKDGCTDHLKSERMEESWERYTFKTCVSLC